MFEAVKNFSVVALVGGAPIASVSCLFININQEHLKTDYISLISALPECHVVIFMLQYVCRCLLFA